MIAFCETPRRAEVGFEGTSHSLYALKHRGAFSARQLEEALDIRANNLHYHLDKLVEVGLVENRKRETPDSEGLYSYYAATSLGEAILDHGVEALMRREWDYLEAYDSDE